MEDLEIVNEFLVESNENLARLDQEMVSLEKAPENVELLGSVFRTIHTIKGTCGFLGFSRLETLTHAAEDILSQLRHGDRRLDTPLASLILEAVDAVKRILGSIEAGAGEGEPFELDLLLRLEQTRDRSTVPATVLPANGVDERVVPEIVPPPDNRRAALMNSLPCKGSLTGCPSRTTSPDNTLRVDVGLLDRLMNLVGELVLTRNQVVQYNASREDAALSAVSQRLNLITTELQEGVMKTRMQPIGIIWNKLPRVVRDLAASLHKQIELEMDGADTELDRTIIEAIKDPLTHIVRNSCDHGIEKPEERTARGKNGPGRLTLRAFHEGGQVNIEITDDGAGIDAERVKTKAVENRLITAEQALRLSERDAINLVFLPGFSTAQSVTNISGRGVGMDVVRTHIERIGGTVDLTTGVGHGTTVRVKIPLTLAIIPGLLVSAGGERFVIPQISLDELIRLEGEAAHKRIEYIHATPLYRRRDALLPLVDLCGVLGLAPGRPPDEISIVVVKADGHPFGLIVDSISDSQEIVVKPLGAQLKGLNCYAGATIMGDGKVALILDVAGIGLRSSVISESGRSTRKDGASAAAIAADRRRSLLLFRAGGFPRLAMPLSHVARLEKIPRANVERAAGREVLQYRNGILPLVSLAEMLGGAGDCDSELIEVVVYRTDRVDIGLVVDEITDVVEEEVANPFGGDRPGVLGSAVVAGKVTDFLDLEAVTQWASLASAESLQRLDAAISAAECRPAMAEVGR